MYTLTMFTYKTFKFSHFQCDVWACSHEARYLGGNDISISRVISDRDKFLYLLYVPVILLTQKIFCYGR